MAQLIVSDYVNSDYLFASDMNKLIAERDGHLLPIKETEKTYSTGTGDIGSGSYEYVDGFFSGKFSSTNIKPTGRLYVGAKASGYSFYKAFTTTIATDNPLKIEGGFLLDANGTTGFINFQAGGGIAFTARTEYTISAGSITLGTDRVVLLNPETAAADTLNTIDSGEVKYIITVFNNSGTYPITLTHSNDDNGFDLYHGLDVTLTPATKENITLYFNGSQWIELSRTLTTEREVFEDSTLNVTNESVGYYIWNGIFTAVKENKSVRYYNHINIDNKAKLYITMGDPAFYRPVNAGYRLTITNWNSPTDFSVVSSASYLTMSASRLLSSAGGDSTTIIFDGTRWIEMFSSVG